MVIDLRTCPECDSPAVARRYIQLEDPDRFTFITWVCKSCEHEWLNDADLPPEVQTYLE